MNTAEIKTMALELSQKCKWQGDVIMDICAQALEDSNFHAEASIVNNLIKINNR